MELVFKDENNEVIANVEVSEEEFDVLTKQAEEAELSLEDYLILLIANSLPGEE